MRVHLARAVGGREAAVSCAVTVSPNGVGVSRTSPSAACQGTGTAICLHRWPDRSRHEASWPPRDAIKGCTAEIKKPDPESEEDAKALSEAFFSQLGPNNNFGSQFAQTVAVKCNDAHL
jgi:Protein of unknown function (DUF1007)